MAATSWQSDNSCNDNGSFADLLRRTDDTLSDVDSVVQSGGAASAVAAPPAGAYRGAKEEAASAAAGKLSTSAGLRYGAGSADEFAY